MPDGIMVKISHETADEIFRGTMVYWWDLLDVNHKWQHPEDVERDIRLLDGLEEWMRFFGVKVPPRKKARSGVAPTGPSRTLRGGTRRGRPSRSNT